MATTKSNKHNMSKSERQQMRERAQERAQAALDRLGEGVRAVYDSERWESWLQSLSRIYDYSLGNTILIAMQMPTATHVAPRASTMCPGSGTVVLTSIKGLPMYIPLSIGTLRRPLELLISVCVNEDEEFRPAICEVVGFVALSGETTNLSRVSLEI